MKKFLISLATVMTMGLCCSSVFASELSVKVGYNFTPSKAYDLVTSFDDFYDSYGQETVTISGMGGGGLVVSASAEMDINQKLSLKSSASVDFLNKRLAFILPAVAAPPAPTSLQNEDGSYDQADLPVNIKKYTLTGDSLLKYKLKEFQSGFTVGLQGGVNFVATSIYDCLVVNAENIADELVKINYVPDEQKSAAKRYFLSNVVNMLEMTKESADEMFKVWGGSAVIGAFLDYNINDKMSLSADGYFGVMSFGNIVNSLKNYKLNGQFRSLISDDIEVNAGLEFSNLILSKTFEEQINQNNEASVRSAYYNSIKYIFNYTYRQIVPSLSVSYNF